MEFFCSNCKFDDNACTEAPCTTCINNGGTRKNFIPKDGEVENPIKPEYYNDTKITPIDVIDDWRLNFYLGSAIKYIKRAGKKANNSKLQDLKKVRAYIDHEIKVEEARE